MSADLTVAVVIPVYNCEAYVEEALDSIEAQTRRPERVVVVDDGSTDGSARIVADFIARSTLPIQLIEQSNAGIAAARNTGIRCCTEDLIALLDSDDTFYPTFLERASSVLTSHPELILCFLDRDVVDGAGNFMRRDLDHPNFRAMPVERYPDGTAVLAESPFVTLASGNVIPIGLMARRSALEAAGGFDEEQRAVEDRPLLMRLSKIGKFGFIDECLGIWRRHGANTSGPQNAYKMVFYGDLALAKLEQEAAKWSLTAQELAAIREERARMAQRLLYTTSRGALREFFPTAAQLMREGRVGWRPTLRSILRYVWYRAARWRS